MDGLQRTRKMDPKPSDLAPGSGFLEPGNAGAPSLPVATDWQSGDRAAPRVQDLPGEAGLSGHSGAFSAKPAADASPARHGSAGACVLEEAISRGMCQM